MQRAVKKFRLFLILCFLTGLPKALPAAECGFRDGGYCVDAIWRETSEKTGFSSLDETAPTVSSLYTRYEALWDRLVQTATASESEKKAAFEEAGMAGGTKIGGVNLVVLAARTLQKLADIKVLSLEEAQGILERSRRSQDGSEKKF